MSLQDFLSDEPVRFASALTALGVAVSGLVAIISTGALAAAVGGVWAAAVGLYNVVFVRNKVTPNTEVTQKVHDTIVALAPYAPGSSNPLTEGVPGPPS